MLRRLLLTAALGLAIAGCSHASSTATRTPLTEAQRDTAIANSILPGASVVDRAMRVAGQEQRRADRMDSLVR